MAYKVIENFADTHNNNRVYREGDTFPSDEHEASEERIKELVGKKVIQDEDKIKDKKKKEAKQDEKDKSDSGEQTSSETVETKHDVEDDKKEGKSESKGKAKES